jgi:hypothetical protein
LKPAVTIENVTVVAETEKGLKVEIRGVQKWIPKSVVLAESEVYSKKNGGPGKLIIDEWFAEKEGIA